MKSIDVNNMSPNEAADFWRYKVGANVTPANTRDKIVTVFWKPWQTEPISEQQHNRWKEQRAFDLGLAIMAGPLWHIADPKKKGKYLILVDFDNQKAIDELCSIFDCSLKEISNRIIVEQHRDQPNRAHLIFYATHQFPKKGPTVTKPSDTSKHEYTIPPAIEVTRMLYCSPSVHKNGENYKIIGTEEPETMDEMEKHLQDILKKYGIKYPSGNDAEDNDGQVNQAINDNLTPMSDLFRKGIKIFEGQNRHEALMRIMEHVNLHNPFIDEEYKQKFCEDWNEKHCEPPLDKKEFSRQWKAAVSFVDHIKKQRAREQVELNKRRKREQVEEELAKTKERENEKKNPLHIGMLARLNEEGVNHYGFGQLSSLGALYKRVYSAFFKCEKCGRQKEVVFDHPQTRQYFIEFVGHNIFCWDTFNDDFNECDGFVKSEPKWVNALDVEVSDTNTLQDIDRLRCVLLGDDTKDVGIGEDVTVFGALYMEGSKNGPTFPVDYLQSIKYEGREQEELTKLDAEAIKRFRERFDDDNGYVEQLVKMTACNIIGLEVIKEGILYMVARAKPDKPDKRERVHAVIISLPGMAKTALLNYTTQLMDRSTFETAQLATGLSLIVIVENTGDMKVLRLGPVSTSMLACVDEFNRLSGPDQEKFFGVMEEGRTTTVKFGRKVKITAPVTILASTNPPEGSNYDSDGMIDLESMNIIAPILSRFDLKFYIAPLSDEDKIREQVNAKADLETRMHGAPNYSRFLKKMMVYVKQHYPNPALTPEALSIISEAYLQLRKGNTTISLRVYNLLINLAKARAMLLQKIIANSEIAKAVVEYYTKTIEAYHSVKVEPKDPIEVAIEECKSFLCELFGQNTYQYTESELLEKVCQSNKQVARYVKSGIPKRDYFDKSSNKKARYILERLRVRYPEIAIVAKRPVTLKWTPLRISASDSDSDHNDHNDPSVGEVGVSTEHVSNSTVRSTISKSRIDERNDTSTNSRGVSPQEGSKQSDKSESASSASGSIEILYSCYYCIKYHRPRFESLSKEDYVNHCSRRHPGKPWFPGKPDLKLYGLQSQGKWWENSGKNGD